MKRNNFIVSAVALYAIVLSACAPQGTQAPVAEPPATEAPVPQTGPGSGPSVQPVDLAGPPMEVGSTYRYVDGTLLVAVPAGPFTMGAGQPDNPEREITLGDFWVYQTEVTNRQYSFCVSVGECAPPDLQDNKVYTDPLHANDPVVGVNYDQAASYCGWVHGRLPTEAEWEKTARGPEGNIYPWGDAAPACDLLNTANCVGKPTMVLTYPQGQSYYEALDMAGNSFEWVADWFSADYTKSSPAENPLGPEFGVKRSVRSTGFARSFFESDSSRRWSLNPLEHQNDLGFRCVVEDPTWFAPFCEAKAVYGMDANGMPSFGSGAPADCDVKIVPTNHYCTLDTGELWAQFQVVPPDATIDSMPPGCVEGPPGTWTCQGSLYDGSDVQAHVSCDPTLPPDFSCPPGFDSSGKGCQAQGRPGECLAGSTYDSTNQCCSALEANGVQFGCPVGWYDTAGGCSPDPQPPATVFGSGTPPFSKDDCQPHGEDSGPDDDDDKTPGDDTTGGDDTTCPIGQYCN